MPSQVRQYHQGCGECLRTVFSLQTKMMNRNTDDSKKLSKQKAEQRVKQES